MRPTRRRSRQMVPIENINYEAIKQIGSRPRSPINLWPLFLPFSLPPSLRPRPPASSTRTTYKILSSSAAAAAPEHGRAAVSLSRHEPHNNFRFPIKSLSCGASAAGERWGRAETVSFRLVFPKQCGPINYSHARASERGIDGSGGGGKGGSKGLAGAGRQLSRHEVRSRRHGISKWKKAICSPPAGRHPRKRERGRNCLTERA